MKAIVILLDGMRPDALDNIPEVQRLKEKASYTMKATTVMPSVTLPCHMSLFHSVDPSRHGTTTNTYMPQVRPIKGLCEVLSQNGKKCAMFYDWSELRDLTRPGSLVHSYFNSSWKGHVSSSNETTKQSIAYLKQNEIDFAFIYMGYTDAAGHGYGWMSKEYMDGMQHCWTNVERIINELEDEYTIIVTADHGGHDRTHGLDIPEDMLIPLFILGQGFEAGKEIAEANIKDVAPTVTKLLGVEADKEWEGKALFS